jgi:diguanylate cyclase (GGDEF)-like protein
MEQQQQTLLAETVDALLSHICVLNGGGTIVATNKAWRTFAQSNGADNDFAGQNYLAQCDAAALQDVPGAAAIARGIRAVMSGNVAECVHEYPCHSQTEQRWFSARITRFVDTDPYVVVSHLNVTHLQAALALKESQQIKLQRLQKLYAALTEADQVIDSSSDLHAMYRDICRIAVELGGLTMAWVGEPDLASQRILPVASFGSGTDYINGITISTREDVPEGRGTTGTAYRENRTTIIQDFQTNPTLDPWRARGAAYRWQSVACFPVRRAGAVIALLSVYSVESNAFDSEEVGLLEKLSANLSQAADATALAEQQRKLSQQLARSEQTYRTLFETVHQGVVFQDTAGYIQSANPAAERILGLSIEQLQGRTSLDPRWHTIRPDGSPFPGEDHPAMVALRTGNPVYGVVMGVKNPLLEQPVWININATPVNARDTGELEYVYTVFDDISETVRLQQELEIRANQDFLTGVANRRYFFSQSSQALARAKRYNSEVAMLMIDIDHFKSINDSLGHAAGDMVLKAVAQTCNNTLREVDVLGRIGGEEFAVLLPQTPAAVAAEVAERIRAAIDESAISVINAPAAVHVTVSIGVAASADGSLNTDALLQEADKALYQAKQAGRNRVFSSFL